jgi:hypothetical protein
MWSNVVARRRDLRRRAGIPADAEGDDSPHDHEVELGLGVDRRVAIRSLQEYDGAARLDWWCRVCGYGIVVAGPQTCVPNMPLPRLVRRLASKQR